jgi:hypothetical protein
MALIIISLLRLLNDNTHIYQTSGNYFIKHEITGFNKYLFIVVCVCVEDLGSIDWFKV